jgi:predicted DNA-binding transcriptional regulator AlpA
VSDSGQWSGEGKPVFLNAKQVAERYGVSRQWPYHDASMQKLRIKIGGRVMWKLSDLEAFEEASKDWMDRPWVLQWFKRRADDERAKKLKFYIV